MKRTIFILFLFLFLFIPRTKSQIVQESHPAYKHFYHAVIDNDTVLVIELRTFHVFPPEKFKDKKQEKFYWKTVRDVKKTLPYAKLIYSILIETYEYMETLPDDKAREEHMKKMEKEVFQQYKPVLKKFTLSQGKMLIKLINRECNQSSYELIKAFLGSFRANFWQFFGKIFFIYKALNFNKLFFLQSYIPNCLKKSQITSPAVTDTFNECLVPN